MGLRREEPTTNLSSNIPYLAQTALRTSSSGSGSSNERLLCLPLHQHMTSVNSDDYRKRRSIARAPLLRRSITLSCSFSPTDALLVDCSFLCIFYRAGVVTSLSFPICFYICLANHSAVSKPHPTEGAEKYAGCGFPGSCKVCCAVCTPLCAGRCAPCLCCSLFFCCRDFAFSNDHYLFLRNKQNAYEHIHPPHSMTCAYLA